MWKLTPTWSLGFKKRIPMCTLHLCPVVVISPLHKKASSLSDAVATIEGMGRVSGCTLEFCACHSPGAQTLRKGGMSLAHHRLSQSWKPLWNSAAPSMKCGDTGLTSWGSHQNQRQAQHAALTTLGTGIMIHSYSVLLSKLSIIKKREVRKKRGRGQGNGIIQYTIKNGILTSVGKEIQLAP